MKKLTLISVLSVGAMALAATVDWPSDFDANLAARIAATTPSGASVALASIANFAPAGSHSATLEGCGTDQAPLDFRSRMTLDAVLAEFDSRKPFGLRLILR